MSTTVSTVSPSGAACPTPRFGSALAWDVRLAQNHVWNRLFIDMFGYHGPSTLVARNKFERIEIAWDWLCWAVFATAMPVLLGKVFNGHYTQRMIRPLSPGYKMPLNIPFEWVDAARLGDPGRLKQLQKALGTKTASQTRLAARRILNGKMLILAADLFFLALKGQAGHWGKNIITPLLSGKHGFTGEFGYTTEEYRRYQSAHHEQNKLKKWLISLAWAGVGLTTLPLAMNAFLKNPNPRKAASGLGRLAARGVKLLNYHQAIYMSKYLIAWHSLFNFIAPSLLAARDRHEFRERLNKALAIEFFFFVGDDLITGLTSSFLQHRNQRGLKGFKITKGRFLGVPKAVAFHHLATHPVSHPGYRLGLALARQSFWVGLVTTALSLGVSLNVLNNIYTKKKVLKEQADLSHSKDPLPPMMTQTHSPVQPMNLLPIKTSLPRSVPSPTQIKIEAMPMQAYPGPGLIRPELMQRRG